MNGPLPVTISDIEACLNLMGVSDFDARNEFFGHVLTLDGVYLQHWYAEEEKKQKKNKNTPRKGRTR